MYTISAKYFLLIVPQNYTKNKNSFPFQKLFLQEKIAVSHLIFLLSLIRLKHSNILSNVLLGQIYFLTVQESSIYHKMSV